MKAVQIGQYGDAKVLRVVTDAPKPATGNGRILIEVHAASLNPVDSAVRAGLFQKMIPLTFPATLGGDVAGVVVEVGSGVSHLRIGDRVYGQASVLAGASGAFADFASARAEQVAKAPSGLSFIEAAALPLTAVSAFQAIYENFKQRKDQRILIHGGACGIGTIAVQMARHLGAYVATTVKSGGVEYARSLGADQVIDFQKQNFAVVLKDFDAVFDLVGGETYRDSFAVLKKGGIILSMREQPDAELAGKHGMTALALMTDVSTEMLDRISELVAAGKVKPHVNRVFPLEQAKDAFIARENGKIRGKIVLEVKKQNAAQGL
jgi:NADPH:quinone reductase-like Zn-dependent oxidoreductase